MKSDRGLVGVSPRACLNSAFSKEGHEKKISASYTKTQELQNCGRGFLLTPQEQLIFFFFLAVAAI